MDPISLIVGGALVASGWLIGRVTLRAKPANPVSVTVCSCGHGYGTHKDSGQCRAQVERPNYWDDGHKRGYEWVACPCLSYDGPEPLPRVWTGTET